MLRVMKVLELAEPHRRKHFDFFRGMNHPHFSICARVEVGPWLDATRQRSVRLNTSLVYLLSRAANAIPELRQRIRGDRAVEHDVVHPSFAVSTDDYDVFSFCEVKLDRSLERFAAAVEHARQERARDPSMEDEPGRDDYLFLSPLPWVDFQSVTHPMQYHPHDSVPRIAWGKLVERDGCVEMALSLQAHHALVDGVHMGRFFERVQSDALAPSF